MPTGSSPFILLDLFSFLPLDIISNATTALLNGQTSIPADQLINQVDSNGSLATTGTVGAVVAIGTVVSKFFIDRKNDLDTISKGSVTDKMIFNEVIDNLGIQIEGYRIERDIQRFVTDNPTLTYAQVMDMVYDTTTKETYGQRRAKFMKDAINQYEKYYGGSLSSADMNNYTNNPKKILNQTLSLVKDKTGN